jgi:Fanconi anemia group J protein
MENPPAVPTVNNNDFFINGFKVTYPTGRKPFPAQLAVISKVLQAAKERKNALLESPTGTGKVCIIFLLQRLFNDQFL